MKFRVEVIYVNDEGTEQRHDVMEMERRELAMETLGLSLAEGKTLLRGVQDLVVSQQISEDLQRRRNCPACGAAVSQGEQQEPGGHAAFASTRNSGYHRRNASSSSLFRTLVRCVSLKSNLAPNSATKSLAPD
jgi:hypothetical protein